MEITPTGFKYYEAAEEDGWADYELAPEPPSFCFPVIHKRKDAPWRRTPKGQLTSRARSAMRIGIRSNNFPVGVMDWNKVFGYTASNLRTHIESLFTVGMSWRGVLSGEIHIDHIKPIARFDYKCVDDEDFVACWGLKNLQPLWKHENLAKSDK